MDFGTSQQVLDPLALRSEPCAPIGAGLRRGRARMDDAGVEHDPSQWALVEGTVISAMSELILTVSERFAKTSGCFDPAGANSLRVALGKHLRVSEPRVFVGRSADPFSLPSFIQLLGDVAAWSPLLVAATEFWRAYFTTLGKHAADATWDRIASLLRRKEATPLADCAEVLSTEAQKVDGEVEIVIGLSIPDDRDGTVISVKSRSPTDIALAMAAITVHAEEISNAMQTEMRHRERRPGQCA